MRYLTIFGEVLMLHLLYTRLQTPLQRSVAVFIGGVSILLALRFSAGTVWQGRIAALVPAGMAVILLIRFWRRWQTVRYGLMRWEVRMLRSWRSYSTKPPTVEALHLLGIAMSLLSVAGLVSGLNRHHFSRYSAAVRNSGFQTRLVTAVH